MDESEKPFACTIEGCQMTFTNEDHLNWHNKKHDMVLNLGLVSKSADVADQTPTPTRFIRNCEEVGLFQDLQNVNPFDETFKKAIESAKTGTLHVSEVTSTDDTLHTPHIFPPVEPDNNKYVNNRNDNQSNHSNEFCIDSVPSNDENNDLNESYDLTIDVDDSDDNETKNKSIDLKSKLKETIKNKSKTSIVITPVPLEKLKTNVIEPVKRVSSDTDESAISKKQKSNESDEKAKIREMNRAAQLRCRKRKKIQWKKMEDDLKLLKNENVKISQENQNLKHKFYALKELLLKYKKNNPTDKTQLLSKIEKILNSSVIPSKKNTPINSMPVIKQKVVQNEVQLTSPVIPVALTRIQPPPGHKPVLIQVLGSVAQLAVSVLPNN